MKLHRRVEDVAPLPRAHAAQTLGLGRRQIQPVFCAFPLDRRPVGTCRAAQSHDERFLGRIIFALEQVAAQPVDHAAPEASVVADRHACERRDQFLGGVDRRRPIDRQTHDDGKRALELAEGDERAAALEAAQGRGLTGDDGVHRRLANACLLQPDHRRAVAGEGTQRDEHVLGFSGRGVGEDAKPERELHEALSAHADVAHRDRLQRSRRVDRSVAPVVLEFPRRIVRQAFAVERAFPEPPRGGLARRPVVVDGHREEGRPEVVQRAHEWTLCGRPLRIRRGQGVKQGAGVRQPKFGSLIDRPRAKAARGGSSSAIVS